MLASGSLPRALGTPGETLDGVHTYRTLDDAQAVREAAESASSALVIGGGFIGMETTASLRRRGLAVTQIDLADSLYASLAGARRCRARSSGSTASAASTSILGDVVAEFRGSGGRLTRRRHARGREIEAELAIVGVGVQPSTGYLDGSGVELERGTVARRRALRDATSPASGPSATSRTSTIPSSATAG